MTAFRLVQTSIQFHVPQTVTDIGALRLCKQRRSLLKPVKVVSRYYVDGGDHKRGGSRSGPHDIGNKRRIMLLYIVEASVAANHRTGLVLGLVHDFAVISPVELGHRDKGSPQ